MAYQRVNYSLDRPTRKIERHIYIDDGLVTGVLKGLLSVVNTYSEDITINGDKITFSTFGPVRNFDKWSAYFSSKMSDIDDYFSEHAEPRSDQRAYQHYVSANEFALIVKAVGQIVCLSVAETIGADNEDFKRLSALLADVDRDEEFGRTDYTIYPTISEFLITPIYNYLQQRDSSVGVKYGDIIRFEFMEYRNDGVHICLHDSAVDLGHDPDDYGNVPQEFPATTEFPIKYFSESIGHNREVWLPKSVQVITGDFSAFVTASASGSGSGVTEPEVEAAGGMYSATFARITKAIKEEGEFGISATTVVKIITVSATSTLPKQTRQSHSLDNYIVILADAPADANAKYQELLDNGMYASWLETADDIVVVDLQRYSDMFTASRRFDGA